MITTAISAFIGALLSLLITIVIEYQRKPKLFISIEDPPTDVTYTNHPAKEARFVNVVLRNKAMPTCLRWLSREVAVHCSAEIQFYHLEDSAPIFTTPMPARWSGSDEPVSPFIMPDGKVVTVFDPVKYYAGFYRNCYPGTIESLNVVAKFDTDNECYGWSNWSYIPGKTWRNKDRELPKGRFLVKISVSSSGEKVSAVFKLENSVTCHDFRLMPATKQEEAMLTSIES